MRHLCILFAFVMFSGHSCQKRADIEQEKEAIRTVIEAEIKASFYGDYESWTNYFAHEPYTFWFLDDQGEYDYLEGWEEISAAAKDLIKPERTAGRIFEGCYDYNIRVLEEAALATFRTKTTIIQKEDEYDYPLIGSETRFLEKKNDEWKITYSGTIYSSGNEEEES